MERMSALPPWALLVVFLLSAGVIWGAGIKLSDYTDVLAERLHLGAALGGVILLSIATNLPEIAITVAAALSGNVGVAVGNLLGGIAIQTVVLVALDAFGVRARRPLTFMAASLTLVLEAALVVAVLLVVLAGSQLPGSLIYDRLTPGPVLIAVIWVAGLKLIGGPGSRLPWADSGEAPGGAGEVPRTLAQGGRAHGHPAPGRHRACRHRLRSRRAAHPRRGGDDRAER